MSFHGAALGMASLLRYAVGVGVGWLILSVVTAAVFAVFMRFVGRRAPVIDEDDYARMGRER